MHKVFISFIITIFLCSCQSTHEIGYQNNLPEGTDDLTDLQENEYKIQVIRPDSNINYSILRVKPDSSIDYKILELDLEHKKDSRRYLTIEVIPDQTGIE